MKGGMGEEGRDGWREGEKEGGETREHSFMNCIKCAVSHIYILYNNVTTV